MTVRRLFVIATACLLATGCLPHSCRRDRSEAVAPSDSLSRQVAQSVATDTLRLLWTTRGPDATPMSLPRTVRFLPTGDLVVSDVERNALYWIDRAGSVRQVVQPEAFDVPYIAGVRGDTVVVFNAGADRFDFVVDGRRLGDESVSLERPEEETLVYTLATDTALYAKIVGEEAQNVVARLGRQGQFVAQVPLHGPPWRHAGFLRAWGDSIVSLSGFRPVVDVVPRDFGPETAVDSTALVGFDSPMLARSYAFLQGDASKPPLLTVSADPHRRRLFVLNLRPGWLRVDVYDRTGRIERILTEADREGSHNDYPRDLAVRHTPGGLLVAVVRSSPTPQLELYRWTPERSEGRERGSGGDGERGSG